MSVLGVLAKIGADAAENGPNFTTHVDKFWQNWANRNSGPQLCRQSEDGCAVACAASAARVRGPPVRAGIPPPRSTRPCP